MLWWKSDGSNTKAKMMGIVACNTWKNGWKCRKRRTTPRMVPNWRGRATGASRIHKRGEFHEQKKHGTIDKRRMLDPLRCAGKEWLSVVETNGTKTKTYHLESGVTQPIAAPLDPQENASVKRAIRNMFLPAGYPSTVTNDYLSFMLWTFPCHIFGWMYSSLTTASMLQAVGVSAGPTGVAAASAAIKWVTKDGLGAVGRLVIGGRFGGMFDENPRRWRMSAELFSVIGSLLELMTPLAPANFLLLASIGNLSKAIGKGLASPSFRVIQNHFARSNNVGDVAAKEEVWEVAAQLTGLLFSVLLLEYAELVTSYSDILTLWSVLVALHILTRYQALKAVTFTHLNRSRLIISAIAFVRNQSKLNITDVNEKEGVVFPFHAMKALPLEFGTSFDMLITEYGGDLSATNAHLQCFHQERFVLFFCNNIFHVLLDVDFGVLDLLRATLMAAWMHDHVENQSLPELSGYASAVEYIEKEFDRYLSMLVSSGWELDSTRIQVGGYRIQRLPHSEAVH